MNPKQFDELKASVKQGAGILHDLEAEYDELVRLREENKRLQYEFMRLAGTISNALLCMSLGDYSRAENILLEAMKKAVQHD